MKSDKMSKWVAGGECLRVKTLEVLHSSSTSNWFKVNLKIDSSQMRSSGPIIWQTNDYA